MKRFYQDAAVVAVESGFEIRLDGRPVRTPARAPLALPTQGLAEAIAEEWRAQGDTVDPRSMPFTGLANGAIDQIAPNSGSFAAGIARYAESDLLCYRAEGPAELIAREAAAWDPLLEWATTRYDVAFRVTQGIVPVAQPTETLERLAAAVAVLDPFTLAGLSTLVTLSGSLVCGLAVVEGGHDADLIWTASEIDEAWEVEQWGEDKEAAARSAQRRNEFAMARAFCEMARA
ncbi:MULTISPECIES: ATP12 family chaperone protein [Sphingobium]|jgi:chaperone required for assembly of F1-ATPase|uniref:ATPase n=2 Tax=Sphingobium fuliginis (strain ATCC 27551) TaxID=336203 RepID=A0A4Q4IQG0_SPHSA|nr:MULTISPECIES: ATP12 family protein [Sphingobium]AJR24907.1 ATPase [Sphingobium sp. YBL2]MCB4861565.1 ATPase [Sphingobium sp. PNB]QDC36240.1 ATPase [Sphingobium fuliginis ATCC 27551]QOT72070.1 ATPase [Sphingobium fuliginis]RYL95495.1 ATPase [Sphingobium fuliginis]